MALVDAGPLGCPLYTGRFGWHSQAVSKVRRQAILSAWGLLAVGTLACLEAVMRVADRLFGGYAGLRKLLIAFADRERLGGSRNISIASPPLYQVRMPSASMSDV